MKNNRLKRLIAAGTCAVLLCSNASVKNVSANTTSSWKSAYLKIAKKMNKEDNAREKMEGFSLNYTYDLIYFDNDHIPELVVGVDGYWVSMYTYDTKKNKAYLVMDQWPYGAMGNVGYEYLPKKNTLYNCNFDGAGSIQYDYYGKMKNHKIVDRYKKSLYIYYFNDKNGNNFPDEGEYDGKSRYFYGEKRITKKKYDSFTIKGNYYVIVGKMSFNKLKKKLQ